MKIDTFSLQSTISATSWENLFYPYANNYGADLSLRIHPVWSAPLLFTA